MEIPEHLRELVDQLGQAIVQALVNDPHGRELAKQIQAEGFEIALMLEATVALRQREEQEPLESLESEVKPESESMPRAFFLPGSPRNSGGPSALPEWSDEDKAFLKTFKISLE